MWIIDSGVILHVTPRKKFFTSYTSGDFGVLKMGNDGVTKKMETHQRKLWVYALKIKDQVFTKFKQFQTLVERQSGKKVKCIHSDNGGEYCGPFNVFVHVPKDERSKLYMKTRQYIFIGLYDPVEKKLVKSRDVQFMKDQTIEDIGKVKKTTPEKDNSLSEVDQNGEQHNYVGDQQLEDDFDFPPDDDAEEEQEMSQDENPGDASKPPPIQLKRSNRERQSSTRYTSDEYVTLTDGEEPECYQEAMESEEKKKWLDAMQDEIKSLHDNHNYDLMKLPNGKKVLGNRWIYRVKQQSNYASPRYKVKLVVKDFKQKKCVDFNEIFSPVVKMSSIRIVLSLAATFDLEVEQMDVKTTFLHGDLEEEIYMKQPN
ncbi:hypothetical protein CR513_41306, partial [Mucuna pruriens]